MAVRRDKIESEGKVDLADVLRNALGLDPDDRATLAEQLLASLDGVIEEEEARLWAGEASAQLKEYRAGRARLHEALEAEKAAKRIS